MLWEVVESLPVSEDIKKQKGDWRTHLTNYRQSLRNLEAAGIEVICYNFMPVLDWTRTDLAYKVYHGGTCMRFDFIRFRDVRSAHSGEVGSRRRLFPEIVEEAARRFKEIDGPQSNELARNIPFGLPGAAENLTIEDLRAHLGEYGSISPDQLRSHLIAFLEEVVPTAEELGLRLCCHPDDPPFSLLGLPRIMSTEADYAAIMAAVDSPASGITLCSGSLGARPDNDLPGMMEHLGHRVHFLHLRNVKRESADVRGSFHEAEHLGGDTDMVALVAAAVREEHRRRETGRSDTSIPFRPDHGQDILDDLKRAAQPGYPAIGRLKGLAELRGVIAGLTHARYGLV